MASRLSIPAQQALDAYRAAAKAKPGSREAKAFGTAQGFEATFLQNMLESMTSGLGAEGPLGSGQNGGGAWRGFLFDEMSRSMSKAGSIGIAPQVYREMLQAQERTGKAAMSAGAAGAAGKRS
jgi:Rod binding domain-containing protein